MSESASKPIAKGVAPPGRSPARLTEPFNKITQANILSYIQKDFNEEYLTWHGSDDHDIALNEYDTPSWSNIQLVRSTEHGCLCGAACLTFTRVQVQTRLMQIDDQISAGELHWAQLEDTLRIAQQEHTDASEELHRLRKARDELESLLLIACNRLL
ncbi:hypothetical protein BT96DRAFT_995256 [Gymnopus androsaceus JB14]|uniref:Uncharacterized protein n=1 Tax=Gymnopus androsaceus JB14 TaxID=1447944 RepID=A0A6A4HMM4_9AGAR|nr:hypothetical protein BT96DRAFT_995256 [Gymnopus androsaceus JB14]